MMNEIQKTKKIVTQIVCVRSFTTKQYKQMNFLLKRKLFLFSFFALLPLVKIFLSFFYLNINVNFFNAYFSHKCFCLFFYFSLFFSYQCKYTLRAFFCFVYPRVLDIICSSCISNVGWSAFFMIFFVYYVARIFYTK